MANDSEEQWRYDRGGTDSTRRKHLWKKDEAGFQEFGGEIVGKCPCSLSESPDLLVTLLNDAVSSDKVRGGSPVRLFTVHDGVVYIARQTVPGVSYHGYPWSSSNGQRLDPDVRQALEEKAKEKGCLESYQEWMKSYGG